MPVCACVHLRALARVRVRVRACVKACVQRRAGRSTFTTPGFGSSSAQLAPNERKRRVRSGVRSRRASRPRRRTTARTAVPEGARGYPAAASGALRCAALLCDGALGEGIRWVPTTTLLHCIAQGYRPGPGPAPLGSPTHTRTHSPDVDAARVVLERLHGTPRSPLTGMQARSVQRAAHGAPCPPMGHGRGNNAHASLPGKLRETSGNVEKRRETSRNVGKRRKTSENVGKRREASEAERAALRCLVGHRLLRELGAHAVLVLHERIARLVERLRQSGRPARVANAGGWKRGLLEYSCRAGGGSDRRSELEPFRQGKP
jgi:hypothetical protein